MKLDDLMEQLFQYRHKFPESGQQEVIISRDNGKRTAILHKATTVSVCRLLNPDHKMQALIGVNYDGEKTIL